MRRLFENTIGTNEIGFRFYHIRLRLNSKRVFDSITGNASESKKKKFEQRGNIKFLAALRKAAAVSFQTSNEVYDEKCILRFRMLQTVL